ncbi:14007_t:CDS:2, partial [Gigaspora rosea]
MTFEERTEKGITDYEITSTTNQDAASYDSYTFKVMEKRVLRKFDIFILPLCTLLYLFMLVDRSNISNTIAAGFTDKYLQSSSIGFNVAVSAHLIGYVLFEIPSTAVSSAVQLGIVRFFLDEAGFSPAAIDYICLFYARKEITLRYGIFMALAIISGAFTGLL